MSSSSSSSSQSACNVGGSNGGASVFAVLPGSSLVSAIGGALNRTNTQRVQSDVLNEIITKIVQNYSVSCDNKITVSQSVTGVCDDDSAAAAQNSLGCYAAINAISEIKKNARIARAKSGKPIICEKPDCDDDFSEQVSYACTSCFIKDITQEEELSYSSSCVTATSLKNHVDNNIETEIQQLLKNVKDISGELGGLLSGSSSQCISSSVANLIKNEVSVESYQSLITDLTLSQSISIRGSSIWVSNLNQKSSTKSVSSLVAKNLNVNDIINKLDTTQAQALVATNAAILDLANSVSGTIVGFAQIISNTLIQVFLIIIVLVLIFISIVVFNPELIAQIVPGF